MDTETLALDDETKAQIETNPERFIWVWQGCWVWSDQSINEITKEQFRAKVIKALSDAGLVPDYDGDAPIVPWDLEG